MQWLQAKLRSADKDFRYRVSRAEQSNHKSLDPYPAVVLQIESSIIVVEMSSTELHVPDIDITSFSSSFRLSDSTSQITFLHREKARRNSSIFNFLYEYVSLTLPAWFCFASDHKHGRRYNARLINYEHV